MEIARERSGDVVQLRLSGRLDNHWSQSLDEALHDAAREGALHVRLDFSGVSYLSSAGVSVLLKHHRDATALRGSLQISAASERVHDMLRRMGLAALLLAGTGTNAAPRKTLSIPLPLESERASYESRELDGKHSECFLMGNPDMQSPSISMAVDRDCFAIGVGALGASHDECRDLFGEFVAAAGGAAYMPTDGTATPDYMLATEGLVPQVQALYAIAFRGAPGSQLRFEANEADAGVSLSEIVRACASLAGTTSVGIVMAADVTGLVCARLRRSPAAGRAVRFDFPAVREWLSFTPDREFSRFSSLVAGIASSAPSASLRPFLRPLGDDDYHGHFHAVVTAFRPLPRGQLDIADVVSASLQPHSVISVVHLLRDARPIEGAGESEFQRGVCWIFPIADGAAA
ncbi:MAG TPA: STAS domain-containing protein [Vicinamibacterales bacterium]|nr:STAS domain-containing protein [Thermoanaerobaculia bacterium]HUK33799.1 STAS domain-containing protein [Vicinamibacterales bacterium]